MSTIEEELQIVKANQRAHDERDIERFAGVHDTLRDMKENHLFHIERDMSQLKDDVGVLKEDTAGLKVDMSWLKWGVTALIGGVGVIFIALVIRGL